MFVSVLTIQNIHLETSKNNLLEKFITVREPINSVEQLASVKVEFSLVVYAVIKICYLAKKLRGINYDLESRTGMYGC